MQKRTKNIEISEEGDDSTLDNLDNQSEDKTANIRIKKKKLQQYIEEHIEDKTGSHVFDPSNPVAYKKARK